MKHEQVIPDYIVMLESSITILALVGCGWLLFKLVSACIWFPQYMKNLEFEAEKAHIHLEKTLLPKFLAESSETHESPSKIDDKAETSNEENADLVKEFEETKEKELELEDKNRKAEDEEAYDEEPKKDK